jgi:4-phosphopantoate--beta-alanine ligase
MIANIQRHGGKIGIFVAVILSLATTLDAPLEINLFHPGKQRETAIEKLLKKRGAKTVLKPDGGMLNNVRSNRQMISSIGQKKADLIFVPLEDGDRTEALITMGKKVITIDLNPLSRTSMRATVTIVDHIARSLPLLIDTIKNFQTKDKTYLEKLIRDYSNEDILKDSLAHIIKRLTILSKK